MNPFLAVVPIIARGGVGVLPTDTIYGIVGSALNHDAVRRIYALKRRNLKKPMIILIASPEELRRFGVVLDVGSKKILKDVWPGQVSVVFPLARGRFPRRSVAGRFGYLHRGTSSLAFRLPKPVWLRALLKKTGPLVAPSANTEGAPPAKTIREAKKYFGDRVDFYVDIGRLQAKPSTLITVARGAGKIAVLRRGAKRIPKNMAKA